MKKTMKNTIMALFAVLLMGAADTAFGQQSIRHSNYLFNKLILNPGAAGSNDYKEIMAGYRKDWVGFDGAPETMFLSIDGAILQRRIGLGLQVINEQLGAYRSTGVVGTVAGRVRLGYDNFLSVGISGGYFNNVMDGSQLTFADQREMAIPTSNSQVNIFDMRVGVYYKDKKNFGGISVFNILEPELNYTGDQRDVVSQMSRAYYLMAGRQFWVTEVIDLIPSVLYKTTEAGNDQFDVNLRAMYDDFIGLGVSARSNGSIIALAEFFPVEYLRFGYAYDFTTNDLSIGSSGSHEIMVAYRIIQNKELTENPRYLFN